MTDTGVMKKARNITAAALLLFGLATGHGAQSLSTEVPATTKSVAAATL